MSYHLPKTVSKRRISLDNSSLISTTKIELFVGLLPDDEKSEFEKKERRLSLGDNLAETFINTTFLTRLDFSAKQPKRDLDVDCHSSDHGPSHHGSANRTRKQSSHSKASQPDTINTSSYSSEEDVADADDDSMKDDDDDDSDCDSFCDASIGEVANGQYLRRDLGGSVSVLWSDDSADGLSLQSSWVGSENGDQLLESPSGKAHRTLSSGTSLPRIPLRSSSHGSQTTTRPPLRNSSWGSSSGASSFFVSPRRRGRRRSIDQSMELLPDE